MIQGVVGFCDRVPGVSVHDTQSFRIILRLELLAEYRVSILPVGNPSVNCSKVSLFNSVPVLRKVFGL